MSLLELTHKFIEKEKLLDATDTVLVAVSGGMDSIALLDVMHTLGYAVVAAHVNYKLRGHDSDLDADLVKTYCTLHDIRLHSYTVTEHQSELLASDNLQAVARSIRYEYFKELLASENYSSIATAHHRNDVAETFFLKALRGSGRDGIGGLHHKTDTLIRPFYFISKDTIRDYVLSRHIPYREDISNLSDRYDRNFVRRQVIPLLQSRWPQTIDTWSNTAAILADENKLLTHLIQQMGHLWVKKEEDKVIIGALSDIMQISGFRSLLYHLLKNYGVPPSMLDDLIAASRSSGKEFETGNYQLIINRDTIIITPRKEEHLPEVIIHCAGRFDIGSGTLCISHHEYSLSKVSRYEKVDASQISFPLKVRKWQHGDQWKPLGMKGKRKKISDYLIDQKIDRLSKRKIQVLVDNNDEIIWIIGHRISDKIRLRSSTSDKLYLYWF